MIYHEFPRSIAMFDGNRATPKHSDENRRTSAKIGFPKIDQDHSGSAPGLEKTRKTRNKRDFGPEKKGPGIHPR